MLAGIYLKNFKCYQGTIFIPAFSSETDKFIGYLGDNGVGKSAILEALNVFFSTSNKPQWLRNKEVKKGAGECFVAPVFIVDKKKIKQDLSKFQNNFKSDLQNYTPTEDTVIVCVARREDGEFSIFDGKKESSDPSHHKIALNLFNEINALYQYVYIKSEVDIDEEAKINSKICEMIIDSSIVNEVEKRFKDSDEKNILVDSLNVALQNLIDTKLINQLKEIDTHYSYVGTGGRTPARLSTNILARISTEYFLNSKKLRYKNRELEHLSSGQRRVALLDFITAILENKVPSNKSRSLLLAIDEPEISLDTSKKLGQFEKLANISVAGNSVIFTSHWYGWIASLGVGSSVLIEETENGKSIQKYQNSMFPFIGIPKYEMRMIFDFLMSLGASAENDKNTKYIICEGPSDVILLRASLNDNSFKIIPVGKGQVKKISDIFKNYYWKGKGPTISNVLFLIDTDPDQKDTYNNSYLKRWARDNDFKIELVVNNENFQNKCVIENVLEPEVYLKALKNIYKNDMFIQGLGVKYPEISGADAFGMSNVELRNFEKNTKDGKTALANEYEKLLFVSGKKSNLIKKIIDKAFE